MAIAGVNGVFKRRKSRSLLQHAYQDLVATLEVGSNSFHDGSQKWLPCLHQQCSNVLNSFGPFQAYITLASN